MGSLDGGSGQIVDDILLDVVGSQVYFLQVYCCRGEGRILGPSVKIGKNIQTLEVF